MSGIYPDPLTKQQIHDMTCEDRNHSSYCDHQLTDYNKEWANLRLRRGLELHKKRVTK
jgi:hypothetical protein